MMTVIREAVEKAWQAGFVAGLAWGVVAGITLAWIAARRGR